MRDNSAFIVKRLVNMLLAIVLVVVLWHAVLELFHVNQMIGKRPLQVWDYLFSGQQAATNRATVLANLAVTVRDAGIGYLAGLLFAFVLALLFCLLPVLENIVMPTAMVLRSIPLVVLTPLITLIMGIGQKSVTVLVIIVVFLPALANILFGLRNVSANSSDMVKAFGGGTWTLLTKVALPGSVPSLMASAKVSIPSAVVGAMIAEWLSTGTGLGGSISKSVAMFSYAQMWASAITIALVTMIAYSLMSILDDLVNQRFEQGE
ncbi:MAG: ABC transporter permease subunit [Bifidobacterium sp.]|jgi:ABC-type nitrate/sulfonate/bicarbonate transport system permease component|nr:ABC transporter permease subunit [Bifidobacterium sp.]